MAMIGSVEGGAMRGRLSGRRIAFLVANEGIEQVELTDPWQAVEQERGQAQLIAPKPGRAQGMVHLDRGATFDVHRTVGEVTADEFDGLVLPGGVANPDTLRADPQAVALVAAFLRAGTPVAAICHAPWLLVEADGVRGRRLTSWPSLRTDIVNAGGEWVDEEVVVDTAGPGPLVTSRRPADLPAFCHEAVRAFAA